MHARRLSAASVAVALSVVVAGCGAAGKQYALGATEHCLFQQAIVTSYAEADADSVGLAAPDGGVGVTLSHNAVTLGFERNHSDAQDALRGAVLFGAHTGPKLHSDSNVYVSWDYTPSATEERAVEGCLSTANMSRILNKYSPQYVRALKAHCVSAAANGGASSGVAATYCGCIINALQARYTTEQFQQTGFIASEPVKKLESQCQSSAIPGGGNGPTSPPSLSSSGPLRIAVTSAQGRAVVHAIRQSPDAGPKTRVLRIEGALSDPTWVSASVDSGPNTQGGEAFLHEVGGQWRLTILGSAFGCTDAGMPPPSVLRELGIHCQG